MASPKPKSSEIYVALDSFSCTLPSGVGYDAKRGLRLRGDHEVVSAFPGFFASAEVDDAELDRLRAKLYDRPGHEVAS